MSAILLGIAMFMFLVLVHELGHFTAAKKLGVKVLEFGIGIPPKAFKIGKDKQGTEYTVNWIPLGGFVRLKGENPDNSDTFHAKDSFITAKFWKKMVILFAGVLVNFFVAWLFFSLAFMQGITPINVIPENAFVGESGSYLMPTYSFLKKKGLISGEEKNTPIVIDSVAPDSLAADIGLVSGMQILAIGEKTVDTYTLAKVLGEQFGKTFPLIVKTNEGKVKNYTITCPLDSCILGVGVKMDTGAAIRPVKFSGLSAFVSGGKELFAQTKMTFHTLGSLFQKEKLKQLSGPLCIVKIGSNIATVGSKTGHITAQGLNLFLAFTGMISLALAIFNILPIPALDGGRALGVLIQYLGGMKAEKYFIIENYFNVFFFVILMGLGIFVMAMDLQKCRGVTVPFL